VKSRVHPKYKAKYHVGNWPSYDRALVQRGDVTFWLSPDAVDAWRPDPSKRPGAAGRFSDLAIETAVAFYDEAARVSPRRGRSKVRDRVIERIREVGRRTWKKEAGSHQ